METKNILDVEKFVLECNNILTGRFFDIDKRLGSFLSVMPQSEDLLDFFADCIEDFDYDNEFEKAFYIDRKSGATRVGIPVDDKKKIALCINLFNDITNGKINSNQFLETYFQDKKLTPIQNFLQKIIAPFRDSVCKIFGINPSLSVEDLKKHTQEIKASEPENEENEVEEFPHIDDLMNEVEKICNQILAILKFEKKRTDNLDDFEFVLNSIIKVCKDKDLQVINALVIGVNYISKKFKNVRHLVGELNNIIFDYYEFLQGEYQDEPTLGEELVFEDETEE